MKAYKISILALFIIAASCNSGKGEKDKNLAKKEISVTPNLDVEKANYLYNFAYDCIDKEYPNKLGQVLGNSSYLKEPSELHPAFYGCFDWHSSVHGHWALVTILKEVPEFEHQEEILAKLSKNISKENILKEIIYFDDENNKTFERTYGWAWLLKLSEALHEWEHPKAKEMLTNLQPLVDMVVQKYIEFLPKLKYPIRVGEHPNTAFGLSFALDYAKKHNPELEIIIKEKALEYYKNDIGCPITWEPGGFDFLSPCLQEAALLLKVLPEKEFKIWLEQFLPDFQDNPSKYLQIAEVTDRSDGKLAHLDGLNFSRAWCLYELGKGLENNSLITLANQHFEASYTKMDTGEYAGAHWLASFAIYALITAN